MKTQSYSNHVRVHPLYHYFAVPVSLALVPASIINLVISFSFASVLLVIAMILLHVAIFLARDYAKKNQDRIIRAELRLRYYLLTHKHPAEIEKNFSIGQLLALRFACDDEFIELIQAVDTRAKTPDQIKRSIIQWNGDFMRV